MSKDLFLAKALEHHRQSGNPDNSLMTALINYYHPEIDKQEADMIVSRVNSKKDLAKQQKQIILLERS